jgi:hypothetical protein
MDLEQMSSNRSVTRSQARSLFSIAKLKMMRSRRDRAISRRTRMDQTCFGSRGLFRPTNNPLFQRRLPLSIERTGMGGPPRAALRVALPRAYDLYRLWSGAPKKRPTTSGAKRTFARSATSRCRPCRWKTSIPVIGQCRNAERDDDPAGQRGRSRPTGLDVVRR